LAKNSNLDSSQAETNSQTSQQKTNPILNFSTFLTIPINSWG